MNSLSHIKTFSKYFKLILLYLLLVIPTITQASLLKENSFGKALQEFESVPFITIWKTDNVGITNLVQIEIPTDQTGELVYNYDIYWEDVDDANINGSASEITGNYVIDFPTSGTYKVEITGAFPKIYFNNSGDKSKILAVEQWGDIVWEDMGNAFYGCDHIAINAIDAPDLSVVTNLRGMFRASSINQSINHWDVSNVTDIMQMFRDASDFNQPLDNWQVGNVILMNQTFNGALKFNQNIGSWEVGQVTAMNSMFNGAFKFNQDISLWDVGNVTSMRHMFFNASSFNQDISQWDVNNVTDMSYMFQGATIFNQPIGSWDIGNVTAMNQMFGYAENFNADLSNWKNDKATNLSDMFRGAISFNQNLSNWDVSQVTNMTNMFYGATAFDQDISNWDVSNVANMSFMLRESGLSPYHYDALLEGWLANGVQNNIEHFQVHGLKYCQGSIARQVLIDTHNWNITGDSPDCSQTLTFDALSSKVFGDPDFKLNGKVSSGATIHYTSSDESVAVISGNTVIIKGAGITNIVATQSGNDFYLPSTPLTLSRPLTIEKADQTIVFDAIPSKLIGDDDFELDATIDSGLAIAYTSSDESVATIDGNTVTIVGEGTTIITASQNGNENYNAATPVEQTLVVNKKEQIITFDALQAKTILDDDFDLTATSTSGLEVVYTSSDELVATVLGNRITIVGLGTTLITASQSGNAEYAPALEVVQELIITKAPQEIIFESLSDQPSDAPDFDLVASASSGLEIVFSVSGPASLEGKTLSLKGTAGIVMVTASQGGNDKYSAAESVVRSFEVIAVTGVQDLQKEGISIYPNPVVTTLMIEFATTNRVVAFIYDAKGKVVLQQSLSGALNKLDFTAFSSGLYFIKIQLNDKVLYHKVVKE